VQAIPGFRDSVVLVAAGGVARRGCAGRRQTVGGRQDARRGARRPASAGAGRCEPGLDVPKRLLRFVRESDQRSERRGPSGPPQPSPADRSQGTGNDARTRALPRGRPARRQPADRPPGYDAPTVTCPVAARHAPDLDDEEPDPVMPGRRASGREQVSPCRGARFRAERERSKPSPESSVGAAGGSSGGSGRLRGCCREAAALMQPQSRSLQTSAGWPPRPPACADGAAARFAAAAAEQSDALTAARQEARDASRRGPAHAGPAPAPPPGGSGGLSTRRSFPEARSARAGPIRRAAVALPSARWRASTRSQRQRLDARGRSRGASACRAQSA
jgi:hypothetical protein